MAARLIDGRSIAERIRAEVRKRVDEITASGGRRPALATVLVGDDPASAVYVRNKHRACEEVGFESVHHELAADSTEEQLLEVVTGLGREPDVDGILVQLPLPRHIDPDRVIDAIDPDKDVDGLTPVNAGRLAAGNPGLVPCTPAGVIEILASEGIATEGVEAVVVGRSALVGRPVASLLLNRDATVTLCHSRTRDLGAVTRRAEILVAAAGKPRMIEADMVAAGATVIDVGITRLEEGLVGDVDFEEASRHAGAITPVPGGVGPVTIAMLLRNTLLAAGHDL